MVLVDCPDKDDGEAGTLLTGAPGALFDRMLAAIGLDRTRIHLTAVCARRPVAGRMPREVEGRLAAISQHHVGLVAPKRLLCLGNAASRAILGAEMPETRGSLHRFDHKVGQTGVVASFHPRFLLEKPAAKAEAWRDLQLLMGGLSA
jgi:DNA polymerase